MAANAVQTPELITINPADLDRIVAERVAGLLGDRLSAKPAVPEVVGQVPRGGPVGAKPTHPAGLMPGYAEEGFTPVRFTCIQNPSAKLLRDGTTHAIKFVNGIFDAQNSQDVERIERSTIKAYRENLTEPESCPNCKAFRSKSTGAILEHMANCSVR